MSDREELIRIEYYHDPIPEKPSAYSRFQARMAGFHNEYDYWKTAVIDSVTFMELSSLKMNQYVLNPFKLYAQGKDSRQWYGGAKMNLEEMLQMRFGALPMNVVVCAHIDDDKDEMNGEIVKSVACVGNLRKRLPAGYTEVYRSFVGKDDKGERFHALQTKSDGRYIAVTRIGAPDPAYPAYDQLWPDQKRMIAHWLVFGDPGSGKSSFAASFPKPMVVFCFDPYGKDIPYFGAGEMGEIEYMPDGTPVRSIFAPTEVKE